MAPQCAWPRTMEIWGLGTQGVGNQGKHETRTDQVCYEERQTNGEWRHESRPTLLDRQHDDRDDQLSCEDCLEEYGLDDRDS